MRMIIRPSTRQLLRGFLLLALLCVRMDFVLGQPVAPGPKLKQVPTQLYFGTSACTNCHTTPDKNSPPVLCRCTEAAIWSSADKHKDAYKNLLGDRGRRMGEWLRIRDVSKEKSCLACHSQIVENPKLQHSTFKTEEGVSCVACHGPYKDWIDKHGGIDKEEWRAKSREEKETTWGMTDLWNPVKRTAKCASCHIGNVAESKVVTHEMYAAGHPPLPGLEVASYSEQMPRHWEYLGEKTPEARKLILRQESPEFERTKLVLLGGLTEFRQSMQLLADQARAALKKEPDQRALDLANFDCYACHHELKRPGWRQERGYSGAPGRPQFKPWPMALAKLALQMAPSGSGNPGFEDKIKKLRQAFDIQPFGKLEEVAQAADELVQWSNRLADRLSWPDTKYDRQAARRLLRYLCTSIDPIDFDTARQMAWAFREIYAEMNPKLPADEEITKGVKELESSLRLKLPAGKDGKIETELPEDTILLLLSARPEVIRKRMAEVPHDYPVVKPEDVETINQEFLAEYGASWIKRKLHLDTSDLTPEGLFETFLQRVRPCLGTRDLLRWGEK